MRELIVNADDLGLAPGVTRGILELARLGIVTSTSLLANMPHSEQGLEAARSSGLDMGLHLNLCAGRPLSPPASVPSLVQSDGTFPRASNVAQRLVRRQVRVTEVAREWTAQMEWMLGHGVTPSHLDSHCHLHAYPHLYRLAVALARRYKIAGLRSSRAGYIFQIPRLHGLRCVLPLAPADEGGLYAPDYFTVLTVLGQVRTARPLQALLHALPSGTTELVCHPGYVDDVLRRLDPLTDSRERERLLLSRPLVSNVVAREDIRLVSWRVASDE